MASPCTLHLCTLGTGATVLTLLSRRSCDMFYRVARQDLYWKWRPVIVWIDKVCGQNLHLRCQFLCSHSGQTEGFSFSHSSVSRPDDDELFLFSLFTECVDSFVSLHFCKFLQQDYPLQASSLPSFLPSHKPLKATGRRPLCTGEALCRRECDSPTHGTQGSISKGKFTMHGCEELFKKQSKAGFAADKRNITQIVN